MEDNKKIEIGAVVRLRSGGPLMTVIEEIGDSVKVVWFIAGTDNLDQRILPAAILRVVKPDAV